MSRKSEYEMLQDEYNKTREAYRIVSDEPNSLEQLSQKLDSLENQMRDYNDKDRNPWNW